MKIILLFLSLFFSLSLAAVDCQSNPTEDAKYLSGFCGFDVDTSSRLERVRGIDIAPNNDIIVVDTGSGSIYAYWEETEGFQRATLYAGSIGMNHAVRYHDGYVWASSDTTVYRWRYNYRGSLGSPQTVIRNMPQAGAHNTRSMEFDSQNRIYVNIGSGANIDDTPVRSRIIRADYTGTLPIDYESTEVFANGTRNECGLRVNPITGDLWGAENSLEFEDSDPRDTNNPADKINIFTEENKGRFYGYPYCYSEGYLADGTGALPTGSMGGGSQHAVNPASGPDDAWCRNTNNVIPPAFPIRAHEAPLDLIFYQGTTFQGFNDRVYLTSNHGAANRSIQVYQLNQDGSPNTDLTSTQRLIQGNTPGTVWKVAPVAMVVAPCRAYGECLYYTDDVSGSGGLRAIAFESSAGSPFNQTQTASSSSSTTPQNTGVNPPPNTGVQTDVPTSGAASAFAILGMVSFIMTVLAL